MDAVPVSAAAPGERPRSFNLPTRLLGGLIILKVLLPVIVLLLLVLGLWQIAAGVNAAITEARVQIDPRIAAAQANIETIRAEGRRLMAEVDKVENTTREIVGVVADSVEPIRKSVLALSGAMQALSGTVAGVLNGFVSAVRRVPFLGRLPPVRLPDFRLPGFELPHLKIDIDLIPDLGAVKELNLLAQEIADAAGAALDEIGRAVRFWWWTFKAVLILVLAWLVLTVVGYSARAAQRFATGWQMLCGRPMAGGWGLL